MKLFPDVNSIVAKSKQRNAEPKASMHSLELVITVIVFVLVGRLIDERMGSTPVFTIIFTVLGIAGSFTSAYFRYMATSKMLDKEKVWAVEKQRIPAPVNEETVDELVVPEGYGQND